MSDYMGLGGTGCTVGSGDNTLTYFNFFFLPLPIFGPVSNIATAADVDVTPPPDIDQQFAFSSGLFSVGEGERIWYILSYTIDPPPDILPGFDLEMDTFTPVAPGRAQITAVVCAGGNFNLFSLIFGSPSCYPTGNPDVSNFEHDPYILTVFHNGNSLPGQIKLSDGIAFSLATNYVNVWMLIDLNGGPEGGGGSSQITGVSARSVPPQEIPEPGTWAMLGAGVTGLALVRRLRIV
jgi:hypothetical protein